MNSKAIGADMVYAWENAEIGMMDAALAAKIMYAGSDAATLNEKAAQYRELQSGVASAAAYEDFQKSIICLRGIPLCGSPYDLRRSGSVCGR